MFDRIMALYSYKDLNLGNQRMLYSGYRKTVNGNEVNQMKIIVRVGGSVVVSPLEPLNDKLLPNSIARFQKSRTPSRRSCWRRQISPRIHQSSKICAP